MRWHKDICYESIKIYVTKDIPTKELEFVNLSLNIESYHPLSQQDNYFFNKLGNWLNKYILNYRRFLLVGYFNAADFETSPSAFLHVYKA